VLLAFTLAMGGVLPGGSFAEAQDPGPTFDVDPGMSWIGGAGWLPDAPITVTIGDPADPDHIATRESGQDGWLWYYVDYDIEVGELVTVSDGVTTKSHTVVFVSVDVDQATHTAWGEADPGATVRVQLIEWAHGPQIHYQEEVVADAEGAWSVDFAAAGVEVEGHHHVWASVVDADGDATRAHWRVYYPHLWVSLSNNYIVGNDLAVRAPIEITIGDPVQLSDSTQTGGAGQFYWETNFDLQGGQLVTVTDGITTLEHLTFPLAITHIDVEADVVTGVGEPGVTVAVFVHAEPGPVRGVEVAADGAWSVDFSEEGDVEDRGWTFDIQPGTGVEATQWEGDFHTSNATTYYTMAGFRDVSADNVHADNIAEAAHHDIARGYADGTYRPANAVRRDQMASFIVRTLQAAGHTLPSPDHGFTDIGGNTHEQAIGQLAAADIVRGRTATSYAPARTVTRDQMASYLVRALEWAHDTTYTAPKSPFTDIAGNTHEQAIDLAYELGLTTGRSETTYAPRSDVRRDQMASFLMRLLPELASAEGAIIIAKEVVGAFDGDPFEFTITCGGFSDTFVLRAGESYEKQGLPGGVIVEANGDFELDGGTTCDITETNPQGAVTTTISITPADIVFEQTTAIEGVWILAGVTRQVTFTNAYNDPDG
jgi:hypothetical protein